MKVQPSKNLKFHPKISKEVLAELYEGDIEHIRDMFEIFIENIPGEFQKLMELYHNQQWIDFGKQAHKIKPTFEMVGRPDLKNIFLKLELHKFDSFNSEEIDTIVLDLPALIEEAIDITKEELVKLNT